MNARFVLLTGEIYGLINRIETLLYLLIFGFWYYKIIVAVKIGDKRKKWKEIEDFWRTLSE